MLAGNYAFIAYEVADGWSAENYVESHEAEAAVKMHKLGHAIRIAKLYSVLREVYD